MPLELEPPTTELDVDAAVVAYPHGAAAPVVAELLERGVRVVDLSADFRLRELGTYEEWYGAHGAPALVGDAVYGLPELHREDIRGARLVANPGCYPTAAILALAPLARAGLLRDAIIDAKSGVSGAGREPSHGKHFVTVDETGDARTRSAPTGTRPRSSRSSAARCGSRSRRTSCRSPTASSSPAT